MYPTGDLPGAFAELGQGGVAVVNDQGGLSWQAQSTRPEGVYVYVGDQQSRNQRIDEQLLAS